MAESAVAKSVDIKAAALNLNAKAAAVGQRLVGVWELAPTVAEPPKPEAIQSHNLLNEVAAEGVIGDDDGRKLVDPKDYAPGGKYRSIVKLLCHHEFQKAGSWMQGTGWLIRPDLLVTAGHCTYDWGHKFGRVVEVKAYIGYHGHQSVNEQNVQFRHVKKVVAPEGWLRSKGNKAYDVGFMQVDKPFTGIKPISFVDTTAMGDQNLGVVGYPGDKHDTTTNERGAHMYEMFLQTRWNLAENDDTMLQYKIDTFGGNSGSPVLIKDTNASVGAHVYGGSVDSFNAASVIGKYGNSYRDCIKAFDLPIPKDGALHFVAGHSRHVAEMMQGSGGGNDPNRRPWVPAQIHAHHGQNPAGGPAIGAHHQPGAQLPAPINVAAANVHHQAGGNLQHPHTHSAESEEGFFDVLKTAIRIGAPVVGNVLRAGLPIALGPVGGPIGALAHAALGAAGKMAESIEASGGAESDDPHAACEGVVERALLAEAVLQTLQSTPLTHDEEESIFSDMKDYVVKRLPVIKNTAAKVLPAMMEPALRIALDSLHKHNQAAATEGAEGFFDTIKSQQLPRGCWVPVGRVSAYSPAIDQPTRDRHAESFLAGMAQAVNPAGAEAAGAEEEGWGDFLKVGLRVGSGIFGALGSLAEADEASSSAEGYIAPALAPAALAGTSAGLSTDALTKRAIVAEAALRAVSKMPRRRLEEEGFFDSVFGVVKQLAPVVAKVAPIVLDNVHPVAGQLARAVLGGAPARGRGAESTFSDFSGVYRGQHGQVLRKQRSAVLLQGQVGNFLSRANTALVV